MCIYRVVPVWSDNWNFFFNVAAFEAEFEQNKFCKSSATFWIKEKKKKKKKCAVVYFYVLSFEGRRLISCE